MPILVERYPYADTSFPSSSAPSKHPTSGSRSASIDIALINNMPDAAMEATVRQFLSLLGAASQNVVIHLKLFSMPGVPGSQWRRQHLSGHYSDFDEFWDSRFDGVIVTGTEPRADDLTAEPYWADLARVVDWAEANTTASVWSCLAAHAAVQHLDGIRRSPLDRKCFGVFEHASMSDHWLLRGQPRMIPAPHSRWNGVCEGALASAGYQVLSKSTAGVDIFIKERRSLFLFFQGHPEYGADTLAREYRRDVARYLRGERASYPELPKHYFDYATTEMLNAFRARAVAERGEDLMAGFPTDHVLKAVRHTWYSHAVRTYTNWVNHIVECKAPAARQLPRRVGAG